MMWGLDVTMRCHALAHDLRAMMRGGLVLGMAPEAIAETLRERIAEFTAGVLDMPAPCGRRDPAVSEQFCERKAGHDGACDGRI